MLLLLLTSSCRSTTQSDIYTNTISDSPSCREIEMSHHCHQRDRFARVRMQSTQCTHTAALKLCHSFRRRYRNMCQSSNKQSCVCVRMCGTGTIEYCVPLLCREVSRDCANARAVSRCYLSTTCVRHTRDIRAAHFGTETFLDKYCEHHVWVGGLVVVGKHTY